MFSTDFEILLFVLTLVTIFIQFYVLYLVRRKSPSNMGEYQFFLIMLTSWDITFSVIFGFFVQPYPLTGSLSAAIRGFSIYFGDYTYLWTICITVYSGINVIVSQNHALLYRYFILHKNRPIYITFMSTRAKIVYIVQAQIVALVFCALFYQTFIPPSQIPKFIATLPSNIASSLNPNEKLLVFDSRNKIGQIFLTATLIIFSASEIASFIMIYIILSTLKHKSAGFSKLTYKLHIQFTMLLTAQLMTPLIFVFLPVAVFAFTALSERNFTQFWMEVGLVFLALYGTTNSLLTIFFIGPYRIHAFNTFIRPWLRVLFKLFGIQSRLINEKPQYSMAGSLVKQQNQISRMDVLRGSVVVLPYKENTYI